MIELFEMDDYSYEDGYGDNLDTYETSYVSIEPGTPIELHQVRIKDWDAYWDEQREHEIESDKNAFLMAQSRDKIEQLMFEKNNLPHWKEEERAEIEEELQNEYDRLYEARDAYFQDDINRVWIDSYTKPGGEHVEGHWRSPSGYAPEPDNSPYEYDNENSTWIWTGYTSKRNEWMNDHYYLETDETIS